MKRSVDRHRRLSCSHSRLTSRRRGSCNRTRCRIGARREDFGGSVVARPRKVVCLRKPIGLLRHTTGYRVVSGQPSQVTDAGRSVPVRRPSRPHGAPRLRRTAAARRGPGPAGRRGRALEQLGEPRRVGCHLDRTDGDAALRRRQRGRKYADEPPALAHQGDLALLEPGGVGHGVPAAGRLAGGPDAETADERLVLGPGQAGDEPAALGSERCDVPADGAATVPAARVRLKRDDHLSQVLPCLP